jgi:hypothetical protein
MRRDSDALSSPQLLGVLAAGVVLLNSVGTVGGGDFGGGRTGGGGAGGTWDPPVSWVETALAAPAQPAQEFWDAVETRSPRTSSAGVGKGRSAGEYRGQR